MQFSYHYDTCGASVVSKVVREAQAGGVPREWLELAAALVQQAAAVADTRLVGVRQYTLDGARFVVVDVANDPKQKVWFDAVGSIDRFMRRLGVVRWTMDSDGRLVGVFEPWAARSLEHPAPQREAIRGLLQHCRRQLDGYLEEEGMRQVGRAWCRLLCTVGMHECVVSAISKRKGEDACAVELSAFVGSSGACGAYLAELLNHFDTEVALGTGELRVTLKGVPCARKRPRLLEVDDEAEPPRKRRPGAGDGAARPAPPAGPSLPAE